jgi:hypothetical protein
MSSDEVLNALRINYSNAFLAKLLQNQELTDPQKRQGPIIPDEQGSIGDPAWCIKLQGYRPLALKALAALLMLQSRRCSCISLLLVGKGSSCSFPGIVLY